MVIFKPKLTPVKWAQNGEAAYPTSSVTSIVFRKFVLICPALFCSVFYTWALSILIPLVEDSFPAVGA